MISILSILIAIAISTMFHDVALLSIVCLVWIGIVFLYSKFVNKSSYLHILKSSIYITIIFIISGMATQLYDMRYQSSITDHTKYFYGKLLITKLNNPSMGYQRYDVRDTDGNNWILKSKGYYSIGDILDVSATIDYDSYLDEKMGFYGLGKVGFIPLDEGSIDDWEYSFDYDRWLKMKGYVGILTTNHSKHIDNILNPSSLEDTYLYNGWDKVVLGIRSYIKKIIISSYHQDRYGGLMLGMIVGDRSIMPKDDYDGFIDSGLVHLIAVSGGNISMIVIFLGLVLFFLPYYIRLSVLFITIVLYSMVCGLDSSVFRAMVMGGLTIFAIYTGRVADGFRVLGIALFVMLLYNPYFLLYDMGFSLSFMATTGIMVVSKFDLLTRLGDLGRYKIIRYIGHNYIVPSIGAILGILPVLLFYNSQYNLTGFVGNLLVIPIVPVVMVGGVVVAILSSVFPHLFIFDIFVDMLIYLLKWIYYISELVNHRGVYITVDGLIVKIFIIAIMIVIMYKLYTLEIK